MAVNWMITWFQIFLGPSAQLFALKADWRFALTVLTRLPVVCHHRIRLRFIKRHSSDDHSVGGGLRHRRSLLVSHIFGSRLRSDLSDLSRAICRSDGRIFPNKLLLIPFLFVDRMDTQNFYLAKLTDVQNLKCLHFWILLKRNDSNDTRICKK